MANAATATAPAPAPATAHATSGAAKSRKLADNRRARRQMPPLLPGLPDEVAQLCLSHLPPSLLFSVCRSWRRLLSSPSFPPYLSLYVLSSSSSSLDFFSFDPVFSRWHRLPPPPSDPPLRPLLRHPSFISRNFSVQSLAVSGNLVLLAATGVDFLPALPRPLIFSPNSRNWDCGPPLAAPRRWCAAGTSRGAVVAASGIGAHYSPELARSVEKWEIGKGNREWEKMKGLKDGKFIREAIDSVGWRGKMYFMVNAAKEGAVYDVERDEWEEMPEGMAAGWRGPEGMAAGWRGPAAAMDEEVVYSVDESSGALRKYDPARDAWEEVVQSETLIGAEQMAAGGGKVCVVCCGGWVILVVDVAARPARIWAVDPPPGFKAVAVHVLPRMMTVQNGFF